METITPKQIYYNPNPFLLSIIAPSNNQTFKINEIDPNVFWIEDKKKNANQMHNFFWLNLLDRKADHRKLKKIIYFWMIKNSNYRKKNMGDFNFKCKNNQLDSKY